MLKPACTNSVEGAFTSWKFGSHLGARGATELPRWRQLRQQASQERSKEMLAEAKRWQEVVLSIACLPTP